jgi:hypothetical protein
MAAMRAAAAIVSAATFVSLKSNPDDDQGCERIVLVLIFNFHGLPGLEIRQIASFVSDPNDAP